MKPFSFIWYIDVQSSQSWQSIKKYDANYILTSLQWLCWRSQCLQQATEPFFSCFGCQCGNLSQGWPEGFLFNSYNIEVQGRTIFNFTLDHYLIVLNAKQGGIKYHFLSLWHDLTWDWTLVSRIICENSTHFTVTVSSWITLCKLYLFYQSLCMDSSALGEIHEHKCYLEIFNSYSFEDFTDCQNLWG